jgi:hypothetical protein
LLLHGGATAGGRVDVGASLSVMWTVALAGLPTV